MKNSRLHAAESMALLLALLASGCSENTSDPVSGPEESRSEIRPLLEGSLEGSASPADTLKYKLYYFRSDQKAENPEQTPSEAYHYRASTPEWLTYRQFCDYVVNLSNEWVEQYDYRLIAIATPARQPEIEFRYAENETDSTLTNLYVRRTFRQGTDIPWPLSQQNYIGVGNLTREAIESGIIPIEFRRAVGQLVFDFSRCDESGSPVRLDPDYHSTLDRVRRIDVTVTNGTRALKWDMSDCRTMTSPETCQYETDSFLDDGLKIDWEQALPNTNGLTGWISPGKEDGVTRFYGPCLLATDPTPENSDLQVDLTFHYADTYLPDGSQTTGTISLSLPRNGQKLTVVTNNYTVTTVKIKENRIIDVPRDFSDVTIDPSWDGESTTDGN